MYDIEILLQECYMRELTISERKWLYEQGDFMMEYLRCDPNDLREMDDYQLIKNVMSAMQSYALDHVGL